jgi:hypothetical protein
MRHPFLLPCLWVLSLSACADERPRAADTPFEPDAALTTPDAGRAVSDASTTSAADTGAARDAHAAPPDALAGPTSVRLPPAQGGLDYQLGGAYPPASGVTIVSRDRTAEPASGLYNICYVNGFQAQPDEDSFWLTEHPDLVLRDDAGKPVIDPDWDELIFDIGSADKRARLATIVGSWIEGCAASGFDAVEIDNLDTYSRSGGRLSEQHAVAFIALLSDAAHARGLAIAQKNAAELVGRKAELRTDFVVAEECARYDECDVYIEAYGSHVLMIEYRREDLVESCAQYASYPLVLRDVLLTVPGKSGYVFEGC